MAVDFMVRESGAGAPIMLIHGTATPVWGRLEEQLARHGRVMSYARRGFGASSQAAVADLRHHAEDGLRVLSEGCKEPATLVGWSIGGVIALQMALLRQDLVRGLVLLEPPLHAKRHPSFAMIRGVVGAKLLSTFGSSKRAACAFYGWALWRRSGGNDLDRLPAGITESILSSSAAIVRELDAGTGEELSLEQLGTVSCPLTVIVGAESRSDFTAAAERLVAAVPGARLVRAAGSGHCIQLDAPDVVTDAVAESLGKHCAQV